METHDNQIVDRLSHMYPYCAIRALEMDINRERYSLIITSFNNKTKKHALSGEEKKTPRGGA